MVTLTPSGTISIFTLPFHEYNSEYMHINQDSPSEVFYQISCAFLAHLFPSMRSDNGKGLRACSKASGDASRSIFNYKASLGVLSTQFRTLEVGVRRRLASLYVLGSNEVLRMGNARDL